MMPRTNRSERHLHILRERDARAISRNYANLWRSFHSARTSLFESEAISAPIARESVLCIALISLKLHQGEKLRYWVFVKYLDEVDSRNTCDNYQDATLDKVFKEMQGITEF